MFHVICRYTICALATIVAGSAVTAHGQDPVVGIEADSSTVMRLINKARMFYFNNPDSCLFYAEQALTLSRKIKFVKGEAESLNVAGEASRFNGNYPGSLDMQLKALSIHRNAKNKTGELSSLTFIGLTYVDLMEYKQGLSYLLEAKKINDKNFIKGVGNFLLSNIGHAYERLDKPDSALWYHAIAYHTPGTEYVAPLKSLIIRRLGEAHAKLGHHDSALYYYHSALKNISIASPGVNVAHVNSSLAELHYKLNNRDSAFYYAKIAFAEKYTFRQKLAVMEASQMLSKLFKEKGLADSALFYSDTSNKLKDELYGPEKFKQVQLLVLRQQEEQQKIVQEESAFKSKMRTTALLAFLIVFIIIALLLLHNNRQKQKAKTNIEKAFTELKDTQQQLIQSEKMASLGELTAGIAHEIQNPLNFVNNFSDVNKELLEELKEEASKGNLDEVKAIATEIISNEEKINHHGKRADSIVKGMLQHSRTSSGQKEPTDINALADEYLRLAYHGLRAKDKYFNSTIKTELDAGVGKINVNPQDIARVMLNLINNAFYAVNEKQKQNLNGYEPMVTVATKKLTPGKVEIKVKDNGIGIPQKVLDKIFQPFFTTKPTGQGTGLGLSLAYDIVKAHGGELKVETKEGEGSEFLIELLSK